MIRLGVNIDHVATLRQARLASYPCVVNAAAICQAAGAHGITAHLREDRRHIQDADVYALREFLKIKLNLEMAVNPEIIALALDVKPAEVCVVPEKRQELTTEGGLDVAGQLDQLKPVVADLTAAGSVVSMFIDPDPAQVDASVAVGAPCIELHTGAYAACSGAAQKHELRRLRDAATHAHSKGLQVNAGHGLTLDNVSSVLEIPHLHTLNIGHSIICQAVYVGLENAVKAMLRKIAQSNVVCHPNQGLEFSDRQSKK